jgi:hypothetical protein
MWRKIAKRLIIFFFAWEVAAAIVSLVLLIFVTVQVGDAPSPESLESIVGTLGLSVVVIWSIWDARRRRRRQPLKPVATAGEEA